MPEMQRETNKAATPEPQAGLNEPRDRKRARLASNMRRAREAANLTISEASHLTGISRPALSRYLSGARVADAITLASFAEACGTSCDELLNVRAPDVDDDPLWDFEEGEETLFGK